MDFKPIDLVYLWCDMADPAFRAKRNETLAKWGKAVDLTSNADCRAIAHDELKFSLRSAETYAPWIRRVFVVMNDESTPPGWFRTDCSDLRVVKLSEILPPEYLPCYCSDTIEHHLWRIPGLSKRFLYANDDMMFGKPTSPDFFFASDGKPICRFGSPRTVRKGGRLYTTYHACMENAEALVRDAFGLHGDFARAYGHSPHHNIDAYDRDDMQECFEYFRGNFEASGAFRYPFRSDRNVQRLLYTYYALAVGRGHYRRAPFNTKWNKPWWRWLMPSRGESLQFFGSVWKQGEKQIARYRPNLFCFNDGVETTDADRRELDDFYRRMFPKPSRFEHEGGAI